MHLHLFTVMLPSDVTSHARKVILMGDVFHPKFGAFPYDQVADVLAPSSEDPKLVIFVITFQGT